MTHATQDCETYSEAGYAWDVAASKWRALPGAREKGISTVGSAAYSEHPSTEVLVWCYDLGDGRGVQRWRPGDPQPLDLFAYVLSGRPIESHNMMFERLIWTNVCVPKYGWPELPAHIQRCSMATARTQCYPGALGNLGDVLQLDTRKDKEGTRLLKKFSMPRDPTKSDPRTRIRPEDDPEDFERLCRYCEQDVATEQAASSVMLPMTPAELRFWLIDQEINYRGIGVDRAGIRDCIAILNAVMERYGAEAREITGGIGPSQVEATRGWLAAQGVHVDTLDADTVEMTLKRPDLPPLARRVLELRALTGSASVKKLYAMENTASADDRIRNLIVHHGARTGRPTGEGPQPLNLPKAGPGLIACGCGKPHKPGLAHCPWCGAVAGPPSDGKWKPSYVDPVLEIMALRSLDMVEAFFGDALLCISGCVRGLFVAREGYDLIASDYSAIEAVVLAMLTGEQWRIDAFRRGEPIYLVGASKITGVPLETYLAYKDEHGDHHEDRQRVGKVSELACVAEDAEVLTTRGYVRMTDVRWNDLLWDGVEWVPHRGLVARGIREVVDVDGVRMTPDHKVNLNGFWKEAAQLVSSANCLSRALATGSANLPFRMSSFALEAASQVSGSTVPAVPQCTERTEVTWSAERLLGAVSALWQKARRPGGLIASLIRNNTSATRTLWPMLNTGVVYLTASLRVSRVADRPVIATTGLGVSEFLPRGLKTGEGSWRTWSHLKVGTSLASNWIASTLTDITSRATSGLSRKRRICEHDAPSPTCKLSSICTSHVYDIAHAGPRNRFTIRTATGHLIVHNCGYGGWINSYKAFGSTEPDEVIRDQIKAWRAASPAVVEFWGGQWRGPPWRRERQELFGVEGAFIAAVQQPDREIRPACCPTLAFLYHSSRDALTIRLPSGRDLTYHGPRLAVSERNSDELSISYMTWNSNPKYGPPGWVRMSTYGGRLTENIDQAVAHDILRYAIEGLRMAGYPTVLHIYDEIVVEVPEGLGSIEQVEQIMQAMPPWAADWPITASGGWRGKRYRKG